MVAQARAVDELANIPDKFAGNRLAGQRHVIEIDSQQAALLFVAAVRSLVYLADVLVEIVNDHPNSAIDDLLPRPTPAQNPQSRGSKCRLY